MSLNIIVIDDSPMQLLLSSRLIRQNSQLNLVGTFADPFMALNAIHTMKVDIVLLDVEMPEIDGFSLKKLFNKQVEVIINSSRPIFAFQAYAQGAADFLNKPLNANALDRSISKILESIPCFNKKEALETAMAV